ncbi:hypothetical protein DFJ73DRAFT_961637 [Zopfochytrium polystomum]|nr:hypothetical protein DFJ73DRAFT_961637 [Zopfochytrium polystomum]
MAPPAAETRVASCKLAERARRRKSGTTRETVEWSRNKRARLKTCWARTARFENYGENRESPEDRASCRSRGTGLQPRLASSAVSLSQSTPRLLERPTLLHTSQPHLESSHQGRSSSPVGGEVSLLATGSSVGGSSGPLAMVSRQGSFILIGDSLRATAEAVTRKAARNRRSVDGEQFRSLVALAPVTVDETGKATVDAAFARTPEGGTLLAGRRGVSPGMAGRRGDGNQERELDTIMTHARVVRNLDEVFVSQLIDERTAKMNVQNIRLVERKDDVLHEKRRLRDLYEKQRLGGRLLELERLISDKAFEISRSQFERKLYEADLDLINKHRDLGRKVLHELEKRVTAIKIEENATRTSADEDCNGLWANQLKNGFPERDRDRHGFIRERRQRDLGTHNTAARTMNSSSAALPPTTSPSSAVLQSSPLQSSHATSSSPPTTAVSTSSSVQASDGTTVDSAPSIEKTICQEYSSNCTTKVFSSANCMSWSLTCALPSSPTLPSGVCGNCLCDGQNLIDVLQCSILATFQTTRSPTSFSAATSTLPSSVVLSSSIPTRTSVATESESTPTSQTEPPKQDQDAQPARVGPVIGGVLGAAAVIGLVLFYWIYRKRSAAPQSDKTPAPSRSPEGVHLGGQNIDEEALKFPLPALLSNRSPATLAKGGAGVPPDHVFLTASPFRDASTVSTSHNVMGAYPEQSLVAEFAPEKMDSGIKMKGPLNRLKEAKSVAIDPALVAAAGSKQPPFPPGILGGPGTPKEGQILDEGLTSDPLGENYDASDPSTWTSEQHWQWAQWQWAYQWHDWQVKQRQWQDQQRAHYAAREEERRKAIASGKLAVNNDNKVKQPRQYKPSPLSRVSRFSVSTTTSESSQSRRVSFASSTSLPQRDSLRPLSRKSSTSTLSSAAGSMSIIATSPEWSAPTDLTRSGSGKTRRSFTMSVKSTSSSSGYAPRRSRSGHSTPSATLSLSGSERRSSSGSSHGGQMAAILTASLSLANSLHADPAEAEDLPSPLSLNSNSGISTSSSSFMCPLPGSDESVAVISITSTAPDGSVLTTQTITLPRGPNPSAGSLRVEPGALSPSGERVAPQAPSFGTILWPPDRSNAEVPLIAAVEATLSSPVSVTDVSVQSPVSSPRSPFSSIPAAEDAVVEMQYPVRRAHPLQHHLAFVSMSLRAVADNFSASDESLLGPMAGSTDSGGQEASEAEDSRRQRLEEEDDELVLAIGQHVVVWRVFPDGFCEGYCVETRRAGFFPVRCLVSAASSSSLPVPTFTPQHEDGASDTLKAQR